MKDVSTDDLNSPSSSFVFCYRKMIVMQDKAPSHACQCSTFWFGREGSKDDKIMSRLLNRLFKSRGVQLNSRFEVRTDNTPLLRAHMRMRSLFEMDEWLNWSVLSIS